MFKILKASIAVLAFVLPVSAMAQGKIAVVNLQEAILQTDIAQKRLNEVRNSEDYKSDKAEFDETNVIDRNHFSGLDNVEDGPRVNMMVRYDALLSDRLSFDASVGRNLLRHS